MKAECDRTAEVAEGPRPYEGEVVHNMAKQINVVLGKNHAKMVKQTPKGQVFKKKSMFWKLPYQEILRVRHYIDVMHIEKNVCESILGTLLKIKGKRKDGEGSRINMLADQSEGKSEEEDGDNSSKLARVTVLVQKKQHSSSPICCQLRHPLPTPQTSEV